ncbi:MAG: gliding motility-associated C-terminal domain-containing protein [Saprospiraceae bacterium]
MKNTVLIFLFSLININFLYSQKEANVWYFGRDGVGLDFNCIPPSVVNGHAMIGWEGVTTVSDRNTGKVLFYTNGDRIYGSNHVELPDGSNISPLGLGFDPLNTITQVLPVPVPGNPDQYYLFISDVQGGKISVGDLPQNGVWGVKIDMTENGGLGAVIDRFQIYNPIFTSEKLMGIPHANGQDYFLIGHDFGNDQFFISTIDASGVQSPPASQSIGIVHNTIPGDFDNLNSIGELKASPDASMLASVISGDGKIELFDFDNSSGIISNARELGTETEAYGISFSPDNSKLFVTTWQGKLIQYDLSAGNTTEIINSKITLFEYVGGSFGSLKIAPDGKIYVSRFIGGGYAQDGGDTFLGLINNPNEVGAATNYIHDGIDLGGKKCNWGLNNLIEQNEFAQIELSVDLGEDILGECDDSPFTLNAENDCATYLWQDGSSEASFEVNQPGTYFVDVIYGNCVVSDTLEYEVESDLEFSLGENKSICLGETIILDASEVEGEYLWQDGSTNSNFSVTSAGIFSVTITNECGTVSDEIEVIAGADFGLANDIKIPNGFTPDGDGLNDILTPIVPEEFFGNITNVEFVIFNRWGTQVFVSNDLSIGWDGKVDDKAGTSDVYVWIFQAEQSSCGNGNFPILKKGDVTLIR